MIQYYVITLYFNIIFQHYNVGDAIDTACSDSRGLSNSAFLSLIELLRSNKK